jgi:hypothetical protein
VSEGLDKKIAAIVWSGFPLRLQKQLIKSLTQRGEIMSENKPGGGPGGWLGDFQDVLLKNNELEVKLAITTEALEFYSREINYLVHHNNGHGLQRSDANKSRIDVDAGTAAREALEKIKGEKA